MLHTAIYCTKRFPNMLKMVREEGFCSTKSESALSLKCPVLLVQFLWEYYLGPLSIVWEHPFPNREKNKAK